METLLYKNIEINLSKQTGFAIVLAKKLFQQTKISLQLQLLVMQEF